MIMLKYTYCTKQVFCDVTSFYFKLFHSETWLCPFIAVSVLFCLILSVGLYFIIMIVMQAINSLKNVESAALLQFLQPILNLLLHLIGDGGETLQVLLLHSLLSLGILLLPCYPSSLPFDFVSALPAKFFHTVSLFLFLPQKSS